MCLRIIPLWGVRCNSFLRAGGMTNEGKGKGNKKSHGAEHVELFILVGDDRIELVPQRTHFEGAKRGANDRERGCRRLNDCREKRKKAIKNPTAQGTWNFSFWWAMTGSNWFRSEHILKERSEAQNVVSRGCRRLYDRREKGKRQEKRPHGADHMRSSFWWAITGSNC